MKIPCRNLTLDLSRTRVMAIVNVTPDSFSDGGRYYRPEEALARAVNCLEEGADILDFGGESTRPGATPLSWEEEWARLEPVFAGLPGALRKARLAAVPVSVDTYHPETARRALSAGCHIVNCVYPGPGPEMVRIAAEHGAALVVPCRSADEWRALSASLPGILGAERAAAFERQIVIDPEIGFGTTREEDLALIARIPEFAAFAPVVAAVSRKRLIGAASGVGRPSERLGGSIGAAVWCAMNGASVIRVHDVKETVQALSVVRAFDRSELPVA